MSEAQTIMVAVQVLLGLIAALLWLGFFARQWLIRLERRFSGWGRIACGLALSSVGVVCLLSTVILAQISWAPFAFATVTVGIILCGIGGQLVTWAPFGRSTKNVGGEKDEDES